MGPKWIPKWLTVAVASRLVGISPRLLCEPEPVGIGLVSLSRVVSESFIVSMMSALNSDGKVGLMARANVADLQGRLGLPRRYPSRHRYLATGSIG